jgi:hypothetical protein
MSDREETVSDQDHELARRTFEEVFNELNLDACDEIVERRRASAEAAAEARKTPAAR